MRAFRALPVVPPSFPVAPEFSAPASVPLKLAYVLDLVQVRCVVLCASVSARATSAQCSAAPGSLQQASRPLACEQGVWLRAVQGKAPECSLALAALVHVVGGVHRRACWGRSARRRH